MGALTLALLQIDGIATVQSATVVMGLPFAFVVYLIMFSLWKSLRLETIQREARNTAMHGMISSRTEREPANGDLWKNRLDRANTFPSKQEMDTYLRETATYALQQVATHMRSRGYDALLLTSELPDVELPQLDLEVKLHNERMFRYQLFPVAAERPDFVKGESDDYYRLEVYDLSLIHI